MPIVPTIIIGLGRAGAQVLERLNFFLGAARENVASYTAAVTLRDGCPRLTMGNDQARLAVRELSPHGEPVDPEKLFEALIAVHQGNMPGNVNMLQNRVLCLIVADLGEPGAFELAQKHVQTFREVCARNFDPNTHIYPVGLFLACKKNYEDYDPRIYEALTALAADQAIDVPALFSRAYVFCDQFTDSAGLGNHGTNQTEVMNSAAAFAAFMASPVDFFTMQGGNAGNVNPSLGIDRLCLRTQHGPTLSTMGVKGYLFPLRWIKRYCARKLAGQAIRERILWINSLAGPPPADGPLELDDELMGQTKDRLDGEAGRFLDRDAAATNPVGFLPHQVRDYVTKLPPDQFDVDDVETMIQNYFNIPPFTLIRRAGLRGLAERLKAIDAAFGQFHMARLARAKEARARQLLVRFTDKLNRTVDEVMRERSRGFFTSTFFLRLLGRKIDQIQEEDQTVTEAVPDPGSHDARVAQAVRKTPHALPFLSIFATLGLAIAYIVYHIPVLLDRFGLVIDWWTAMSSRFIAAPLILAACLAVGGARLWWAYRRLEDAVQQYLIMLAGKYRTIDGNNQVSVQRHFYKSAGEEIKRNLAQVSACRARLRAALEPWPVAGPHHPQWTFFEFLVPATRAAYERYYPDMSETDWRQFETDLLGRNGFFKDWRALALGDAAAIAKAVEHLKKAAAGAQCLVPLDARDAEDRMSENGLQNYAIPISSLFRLLRYRGNVQLPNTTPFCMTGRNRQSTLALQLDPDYVLRASGIRESVYYFWVEVDIPFDRVLLCQGLLEPAPPAKEAE